MVTMVNNGKFEVATVVSDHRRLSSTQSLSRTALFPFLDVNEMLNIKTVAMMYTIYTMLLKGI